MEKDPFRYFRIEAREILETLSQGILELESLEAGSGASASVERLLRASHTLKGAAGVVGHEAIAKLAHRLEELFAPFARAELASQRAAIGVLFGVADAIAAELTSLGARGAPAAELTSPGTRGAPAASPGPRPAAEAKPPAFVPESPTARPPPESVAESVRLDLLEVDGVLASIADVHARLASARVASAEAGGLARAELAARKLAEWLSAAKRAADPSSLDWDDAIDAAERLRVELRADREDLSGVIEGAERRAREALEDARRLRLLPASTLFAELARAARDAASAEAHAPGARPRVDVETHGGELRIDARVLGLLRDALLQLVRNAIAHALEPEAERLRARKPAAGRIVIRFELRGARARVSCRDDGRGIDVAALRAAAVAGGLAPAASASAMDAGALVRLAMRRSVTTRASATELAGRGVGLQVVGTVVERLRGELVVRTEPGRGTEFELDVPVSMTAAPALVVEADGVVATIPLDAVSRTARVAHGDLARSPEGDALPEAGEAVRFASLARVLGAPAAASAPGDTWTAVLLEIGGARAALGVDRVLGVASAVVLPVPAPAVADAVVVGASLDGEGDPRLALEPRLLVEAVRRLPGAPQSASAPVKRNVLVVDDSLTSRMLERSILDAAGYEVTTAASAEEALEIARERAFSLFVVDVEMPGMSGLELIARMRADPVLSATPAVLVTSRASPEDRRRGLEVGARAYIVKGEFAQDEFLDAVRRLIG
ncbi:MAG: response regulator [Labilithrix sp.]|nr:response regulator [Labilithrix sp.]